MVVSEMTHLNKTMTTGTALTLAAIIITTTTMASSFVFTSNIATPAAATTTTTDNTTATTSSSSSGIELSPQPIYQERSPEPNITPINQTHATLTFSGNGTLTMPNTTQTINTTSNGTAIVSFATSSGFGKETIRTEDGETATATLYEIVQFNNSAAAPEGGSGGGGKGIVTAVFQTNSTGMLAPLNGMIAAGIDDMMSSGASHVTLWKWESGINNNNNSTGAMAPPPVQGESSMNTTAATTTNATTTSDANATTPAEQRGEGENQTTPTIPAPLLE
jgi:hypothetical protein